MLNFNLQRENLLFLTRHWKKNLRIFFRFQPVLTGLATIPGMAQRCCDQGVLVEDVRRSFNHQLRIYIDQVLESSRSTLKHPETIIPLHPISFSIFFRSGGVVGPCFDEAIAIFALDECPTTACWPGECIEWFGVGQTWESTCQNKCSIQIIGIPSYAYSTYLSYTSHLGSWTGKV